MPLPSEDRNPYEPPQSPVRHPPAASLIERVEAVLTTLAIGACVWCVIGGFIGAVTHGLMIGPSGDLWEILITTVVTLGLTWRLTPRVCRFYDRFLTRWSVGPPSRRGRPTQSRGLAAGGQGRSNGARRGESRVVDPK